MNTKKINFLIIIFTLVATIMVSSCASAPDAPEEPKQEMPVAAPVEPEIPSPVPEEPEPKQEDSEYKRSVGNLSVSKDTFETDKAEIIRIINQLDIIMKDFEYKAWVGYVAPESINYWSQPVNLRKAEKRLPVKGMKLNSLQDYFKHVFVPARVGRTVTEIRYISDTEVKAVQVQEDKQTGETKDIIYYYFNKIGDNWMVHIPPIEN